MSENTPEQPEQEPTEQDGPRKVAGAAEAPRQIANYRLEEQLGAGGMGSVYRAYDESMHRTVALKILHPAHRISTITEARFVREAWIAGQLKHPNIIEIYTRGEEKGYQYIAMEYAEHGSLADVVGEFRSRVPQGSEVSDSISSDHITATVAKFVELARALAVIHDQGFIHRDIKPQNVLIAGQEKRLKFADFGIAHADDMTNLTRRGDFIGTVRYMSPELLTAHRAPVDKRTDIYSLGVTLYEALTLSLPFEADSEERYISEILSGHSIPARNRNNRIPTDLETVILKATHRDVISRYQTAKEFADDLKRILDDRPILARREGLFSRSVRAMRRHRKPILASATALAALFVVIIVYSRFSADRRDFERIRQTLTSAIETRTSPFELESDWPRLSQKLLKHLQSRSIDETTKLYLRASTPRLDLTYRKFGLIKNWHIEVGLSFLEVFDSVSMGAEMTLGIGRINYVYRAQNVSSASPINDCCPRLGVFYGKSANTTLFFDSNHFLLSDISAGKRNITIRLLSQTFLEGKTLNPDRRSDEGEFIDAAVGGGCFGGDVALNVVDPVSRAPVAPILVDTSEALVEVLFFENYPDNFPKRVFDATAKDSVTRSFVPVKLEVERKVGGSFSTKLNLAEIVAVTPTPMAGRFEVLEHLSRASLLRGNLRILNLRSKDVAGSLYAKLDLSYFSNRKEAGGAYWAGNEFYFESDSLELGEFSFEELARRDSVLATLVITPSIEVARMFGDVDEFWGDTLRYEIVFRAVDKSNARK